MSYTIDASWYGKGRRIAPEDFVPKVEDWVQRLSALDPRLADLGRGKNGRPASWLALTHEQRLATAEDGSSDISLTTINSNLDSSIYASAENGFEAPNRPLGQHRGRAYLDVSTTYMLDEELVMAIWQAGIEAFDADFGTITSGVRVSREPNLIRDWKEWKRREDQPDVIYNRAPYGEPSTTEEWLGGVLRTWNENAPERLKPFEGQWGGFPELEGKIPGE